MNGIRVSILALLWGMSHAQTLSWVHGSVESDTSVGNNLIVEMERLDHSEPRLQSIVGGDGSFTFRETSDGAYALRVTNSQGATLAEQVVHMPYPGQLTIRLSNPVRARPVAGTISAQRLLHPIPDKAVRAFVEAQRESERGRPLEAIRKLEQAVRLYPDYSEARSNLGVQYRRLGRRREALEQFQWAVAIGPPSAIVYGNLSCTLYEEGRLKEAEAAARTALALDQPWSRRITCWQPFLPGRASPRKRSSNCACISNPAIQTFGPIPSAGWRRCGEIKRSWRWRPAWRPVRTDRHRTAASGRLCPIG